MYKDLASAYSNQLWYSELCYNATYAFLKIAVLFKLLQLKKQRINGKNGGRRAIPKNFISGTL